MHEMHIKAHYIKPWTKTTVSKNFSNRLRNILKRDFDPASPDAAWCTDITRSNKDSTEAKKYKKISNYT